MLFGKLFTNPKMWVNGNANEITMGGVYTCKDVQNVPTGDGALFVFKTEDTIKQVFVPVGEDGVVYTRVIGEDWASVTGTSEETEALIQSAIDKANQAQAKANTVDTRLNNIIVENGTSDAEVVAARTDSNGQTFTTLGVRLDTQFGKIKEDLTQLDELRNEIDKAIIYSNLYDPNDPDIINGGYINATGTVTYNENYFETGFIPVDVGDNIYNSAWTGSSTALATSLYDLNKNFLRNINDGGKYTIPYTVENDVAYIRCAIPISLINSLIITKNETAEAESFDYRLKENLPTVREWLNSLSEQIGNVGELAVAKNIFNPNDPDILESGYLNASNNFVNNANYFETGYIPVEPGDKFWLSHWVEGNKVSLALNFYTSNKTFIKQNAAPYSVPVTIPTGCYYVRMAMNNIRRNSLVISLNYKISSKVPYNNYDIILYDGDTTLYEILQKAALGSGTQWNGKKWYAYGTSLTSTYAGKYVPYVTELSGLITVNKGIPGGGICADTRVRDAVMNTTDGKLEADLITVEVGANESTATLGDIYDTGNDTFCGCLNQVIRYLQQYTNAQIVIMSSTPHRYEPNDSSAYRYPDYKYPGGYTKFEMNEAIEKICKLNGVYYIPMGDGIGIGFARIAYNELYLVDQIHHTDLGGYNIARGIWEYLKDIPLWYSSLPS